jgi:transcription-repair coupling factor (superfamily II helicase)
MPDPLEAAPCSSPTLTRESPLPRPGHRAVTWGSLWGASGALAVAELLDRWTGPCLLITATVAQAEELAAQIGFFRADKPAPMLFPDTEVLPYDSFSPHPDLVSQRLRVLRRLDDGQAAAVIVSAPALLNRLPPRAYLRGHSMDLRAGQRIDPALLRRRLEDAGYQRVDQVAAHGEFAVRGSLLDLFPTGQDSPVRLDFLDDQIESLRLFDPDTQISTARIDRLETLPAREMPSDEAAIKAFRQRYRARFEGNPARSAIYREVSEQRFPGGVESYLPLFFDETSTFWDYWPADTLTVRIGDIESSLADAWAYIEERHEQARHDTERPILTPPEAHCPVNLHLEQLGSRPHLALQAESIPDPAPRADRYNLAIRPPPPMLINRRDEEPTAALRMFLGSGPDRALICAESPGRREVLLELLRDANVAVTPVADWPEFCAMQSGTAIAVAPLDRGFVAEAASLAVLTEGELLGAAPRRRRRARRVQDPESLISDLTDLRPGAPVVHAEHGVGRYVGLTNLTIDDTATEFVTLEYAGGDRLHVPVSSLNLISRYMGAAPEHAPLHRLGSDQWARSKRRAAEKIRDAAAELLELHARRAARPGQPARLDRHEYAAFAAGFPFTLTEDQADAVDAVLTDLASSAPMDRLVCGDVGFGKTEVALRAAFLAATNGRQVAVLVPTTLLAQQHYQTFADRFADWPLRVELLSRFRSAADSRQVLEDLANGRVDIVIATHRLLQPNIQFKNLGLLIVDEEHRFGVRAKERLKALRAEVDILTLTATPIPRTLNMALGGLRELSLIATPPESRLSIKTFVSRWEDRLIREACLREMKRGGQVYFVHNRIEDIQATADKLMALLPEARIEVAHGQMRERDLERIMLDFYHRRFHILVCTAIIESGLDVPSANTIIINRADHFGLAQLHQLRGRVGRSHHQAFAYLLTPPREALTADAQKRLEAIESLEDLGAGFVLATHDLEIRGAGELLGEEQSGQIQEIGFSLYNEMLVRTVEAIRAGVEPGLDLDLDQSVEINLHLPALIPEDYMPDVHLRLVHYKRIASAAAPGELDRLQVELIDRFGLIPPATRNLFRQARLRLLAAPLGLRRIDLGAAGGRIEFAPETRVDPAALVRLLESRPDRYRLDAQQRLRIVADLPEPEQRFEFLHQALLDLGAASPASSKPRSVC